MLLGRGLACVERPFLVRRLGRDFYNWVGLLSGLPGCLVLGCGVLQEGEQGGLNSLGIFLVGFVPLNTFDLFP